MYFIESSNRLIELSLDIDEQKKHEKRLEEAKRKAEEAYEETREFLSSISHEVAVKFTDSGSITLGCRKDSNSEALEW